MSGEDDNAPFSEDDDIDQEDVVVGSDEEEDGGEDEDEDDEEDEDEDEEEQNRPKKRSKPATSIFLDDMAESDEDEVDGEDPDDDTKLQIEETAKEIERQNRVRDERRKNLLENMEKRAARADAAEQDGEDDDEYEGDGGVSELVSRQALLPGVRDPKLFLVKCNIGKEKLSVMALMRKSLEFMSKGKGVPIMSAVATENLKGMIYIEAFRREDVIQGMAGITSLNMGKYNQQMISIEEMPDVLRVVKEKVEVKPDGWCRLKRSKMYKGDLANIYDYDSSRNIVTCKLVPRIDYTTIGESTNESAKRKRSMKSSTRPRPKAFNAEEIRRRNGDVIPEASGGYTYMNKKYGEDGFLYLDVRVEHLELKEVHPTLAELQHFQMDSSEPLNVSMNHEITFHVGDQVEVTDGPMKNIIASVASVDTDTKQAMVNAEGLKNAVPIVFGQLRKYFKQGDHVKVIVGQFEGETGLVVKNEGRILIILTDLSHREIKVFAKDLTLSPDVSRGLSSLGEFQLHDLVTIDAETVGCVVRVEMNSLKILDQNGTVRNMRPSELRKKLTRHGQYSLDSDGNELHVADIVEMVKGFHKGKQGTIKHMFRNFLFTYARENTENSGILAVRKGDVLIVGTKGGRKIEQRTSGGSFVPASPRRGNESPRQASSGGGGNNATVNPNGYGRVPAIRRDKSLQNVQIIVSKGSYKGFKGVIRDATDVLVKVELQAHKKMITLKHNEFVRQDGGHVRPSFSDFANNAGVGSQTPNYGNQTPRYGGQTPAYGSQTPRHDGSQTPQHSGGAWDPTITNTPARPSTPGGAAWTPSGADYMPTTPAGAAAATPVGSAPTPGPYDAATPAPPGAGGYTPATPDVGTPGLHDARTPVGHNPITPGAGYSAQTPGPGGYTVPTPSSGYNVATPGPYGVDTPGMAMRTPMGTAETPHTPGAYTYGTPATPGGNMRGAATPMDVATPGPSSGRWVHLNIEVCVVQVGHRHYNEKGIVRHITAASVTVELLGSRSMIDVSERSLESVQPVKNDMCMAVRGSKVGMIGTVNTLTADEAIIADATTDEISIVPTLDLAKYHQ